VAAIVGPLGTGYANPTGGVAQGLIGTFPGVEYLQSYRAPQGLVLPVPYAAVVNRVSALASTVNNYTTPTFTPGASSLLIVIVDAEWDGTAGAGTIGDTLGGLVWTQIANTNDANFYKFAAWYAQAPSSPTAGTITVTFPSAAGTRRWAIIVDEVPSIDTVTPVVRSVVNTTAFAATVPINFAAGPTATDYGYAAILQEGTGPAPTAPSGFIQATSQQTATGTGRVTTAFKPGSVAQNNSWTNAPTNQTVAFALEIKPSTGTAPSSVTLTPATLITSGVAVTADPGATSVTLTSAPLATCAAWRSLRPS
jgi:hypothetical protein